MFSIERYRPEFFEGVKVLWETCFPNDPPWNRAEVVIPAKLRNQPEFFLVAVARDEVIGASIAGYDGHRGWLYSVAVAPSYCRRGVGSELVHEMERRLTAAGCRKIKLQVLSLNLSLLNFYHAVGYTTENRIGMGKRLLGLPAPATRNEKENPPVKNLD